MTTTTTRITTRWAIIATVGYQHSVDPCNEERRAHGAVCHLESRRTATGAIRGRRVNSNGYYREIGNSFELSADELARWRRIGASR